MVYAKSKSQNLFYGRRHVMRGDRDKIIALAGHTQRPDIRVSSAPVIEHRGLGAWNAVFLTHLGLSTMCSML